MFKLESAVLGLDLKAMSGGKAQQAMVPMIAGIFGFTCAPHGAPADQQSKGTIAVTEVN